MKSLVSIIGVSIIFSLSLGDIGRAENSPGTVSFQIAPTALKISAIQSFQFTLYVHRSQQATLTVRSAQWELRDISHHHLAALIPTGHLGGHDEGIIDERQIRYLPEANGTFNSDVLRHIGLLDAGDYQLALLINGHRASNVIAFTIDPAFKPDGEPALRVGVVEAPPGEKWGSLACWAVGPMPEDSKFTNFAFAMAAIWVDGKEVRREGEGAWAGPIAPILPGQVEVRIYSVASDLGIDPSQPHNIYIKAGGQVSPTARLNFGDQRLATSWDAATPTLGPAPPTPVPLLTGRVLGRDGKPAVGWQVNLEQNTWPGISELTDADGRYAFPGVHAGSYTLVCAPTNRTPTHLDFSHLVLAAGETRHLDMNWIPPYSFTGEVTDARGHGLNHIEVAAVWRDTATGADCVTTDLTWRDGSYTLKGPFPTIVSVSLMNGLQPPYGKVIKPGARHVDFVVRDK